MRYGKKGRLEAAGIYFAAWAVFCLAETVFRFTRYATLPWYKPPADLLAYLLFVLAYGLLGALAGLITSSVFTIPSQRSPAERTKARSLHMAVCQTLLVLLYSGNSLYNKHIPTSPDFILLYLAACAFALLVVYALLKRTGPTGPTLSHFLSLSLIVNTLLLGGTHVYRRSIESKMANLPFSAPADICALLAASFLIYWLLNRLLPRQARRIVPTAHSIPRTRTLLIIGGTIGLILLSVSSLRYLRMTAIAPLAGGDAKPNIVIITMDTARCDHLSCYGYSKKTTPNLDQLARESLLFQNAFSTSSWTLPAHASLFTGLYPSSHGAHATDEPLSVLSEEKVTLAEVLSENGYKSAGFIGGHFCSSLFGMSQGFDYYDDNLTNLDLEFNNFTVPQILRTLFPVLDVLEENGLAGKRIASQVNKAALAWLKRDRETPFFLFLNYFDPHNPYHKFRGREREAPDELAIVNGRYVKWERRLINRVLHGGHTLTLREREYLIDRYDSEIGRIDRAIGELLTLLKQEEIYDNSLIIVTSDHGELFGEHGLMLHPPVLYEELIKVPLIVKYPKGHERAGHSTTPVSLTDIMPEVLTVVGIPVPPGVQGRPFRDEQRQVIAERFRPANPGWARHPFGQRSLRAIYEGDYKLIWASNNKHELYNLREDPNELNNLLKQMPEMASRMENALHQLLHTPQTRGSQEERFKIDKEVEETLKAMGYLE